LPYSPWKGGAAQFGGGSLPGKVADVSWPPGGLLQSR
jgi:hypothetical protein